MYMRTARRFSRSRAVARGGAVARQHVLHERLNFVFTLAAGAVTSVNMLAQLEAYLGYNVTGTVKAIHGYFNVSGAANTPINGPGIAIGVFAAELSASPVMTVANNFIGGNPRYLPWMYHMVVEEAPLNLNGQSAWGARSQEVSVRVKRTIKTIDQDLQLYAFSPGQASTIAGYFHIMVAR